MNSLTPATTRGFLDRFYNFHDSLLRTCEITYSRGGQRSIVVTLRSRDSQEKANEGWVKVRLRFSDVRDYCISDATNSTIVVIFGVGTVWENNILGLDFDGTGDDAASLEEIKSSEFFVTGAAVEWSVEPD